MTKNDKWASLDCEECFFDFDVENVEVGDVVECLHCGHPITVTQRDFEDM